MTEIYCAKCKSKKEMVFVRQVVLRNGKIATRGACPFCGTRNFWF